MITINVTGLKELEKQFGDKMPKQITKALASTLKDTAFMIDAKAKIKAPVDTGFLRANIVATQKNKNQYDVVSQAPYSKYQEYGTSRMRGRPYMRPAAFETEAKIPTLLIKHLGKL